MSIDHRQPPFKKGDNVKGYEIQRLIGSGGQGFVYEAIDDFLKLPVAVKAIPNTLESTRNLRERAQSEAQLLARIRHPNVVQVTTADVTDDGVVCIVMDLLRGRSLRAMLRELNRISVDEALLIGEQIAEGVQAAHEQLAIHRDLKPENVYIEPGNLIKVLDFGIAKITGLSAVTTQENLVQGTVQYMSPEHLQARPVTPRSDVFALGCVLYELMSGSTPATIGVDSVTVQLAGWNQIMLRPPRLDLVVDNVPPYVGRAIQVMLAKEPEKRPATMAQVASELRALFVRHTGHTQYVPRELWREGAGAAPPLPMKAFPAMATTTAPGVAMPEDDEDDRPFLVQPVLEDATAPHRFGSVETKPLPLMVRDASPKPESPIARNMAPEPRLPVAQSVRTALEPSVVVRGTDAPAPLISEGATLARPEHAAVPTTPTTSDAPKRPTSQDTRPQVASAERMVARPRTQLQSASTGVPVNITARKKPSSLRIPWPKLVAAIGLGALLGAIGLLGMAWSSNHKEAMADPSAEAQGTVVAPPIATPTPTSATATPAPSVVADVVSEPSASAAASASALAVLPQLLPAPQREPQPTLSATPTAAMSAAIAKPLSRKAKAPPNKLPFSGNDLIFDSVRP